MSSDEFQHSRVPVENIYLRTPDFSSDRIMGYNTGIRPFRKSGVRLDSEVLADKLIIHNYGYGGSGLTLCWGGAAEVLRILDQEISANPVLASIQSIAIIGAGVIGLATAHELLQHGYQVRIYADKFSPELTSNIAAGIISPPVLLGHESDSQIALLNTMLDVSVKRYLKILRSEKPEFEGIREITDYRFESGIPSIHEISSGRFQQICLEQKNVRVHFDNGFIKHGIQVREAGLDGKIFISDLYANVIARGAIHQSVYFSSKNDICNLREKIIINCTSLGSRELFKDDDFYPVKGHLIYFHPQKEINYSFYADIPGEPDYWLKLYPWHDRLILGGMYEKGNESSHPDMAAINKLLSLGRKFFGQQN
jgi:hypothetical protein